MNAIELREKIDELLAKQKEVLDLADTEARDMTDEETASYEEIDKDIDKLRAKLVRQEKLEQVEGEQREREERDRVTLPNWKRKHAPPQEFTSVGEFLHSVRFRQDDPRLSDYYQEFETRGQSMGSGVEGGFAIPEQFRPDILSVTPQEAIFRPRCTVIPAGDPPDAKMPMPALDQGSNENMYGGITVAPVAEGGTKPETDAKLRQVSLEPNEVAGWVKVTDKLLRNWGAASAFLGTQLRRAVIGWEDDKLYRGNGVGIPLGVTNAPAAIKINRATANQVAIADIRNMYSRIKFGGSYVWVASQTTLPYLMQLQGGNSENIFIMDASRAVPMTLLGVPIMFADRAPALGTEGDLSLLDLSYYLIKDGSGPFVDASPHVYFTSNQTVIKIFWNVDGKPWLNEPIPLEGSTSNTVSPFVVLK